MTKVRDENRYNLTEIACRIEAARASEIGQPVSFSSFEIEHVESVLESGLEFHPEVAISDRRELIWKSIFNAATDGKVTKTSLLNALRQAEINYLKQPLNDFVLATSLNLTRKLFPKRKIVGDTLIVFSEALPKSFKQDIIQEDIERFIDRKQFDELLKVRIHVQGRSQNDAFNRALDSLDIIRGIWNFTINSQTRMRRFYGFPKHLPFNKIISGPLHTLHSKGGSLAIDTYWYEPGFPKYFEPYDLSKEWNKIKKWKVSIRNRIKQTKYSDELEEIFVRYARTLDNTDYNVAFTKLWALLEKLTNAPGKYDLLIKRCLFLETDEDRNYTRLIIEHLRDLRNGIVHDDKNRDTMLTYIYQLKWFIEGLIRFHLFYGFQFKSLPEACSFLELPYEVSLLQERIDIYKQASTFRAKRAKI